MRGERRTAPRWIALFVIGSLCTLLLACVIPWLGNPTAAPTATPSPTAPLAASPTTPSTTSNVFRITEQDMNQWLQSAQTRLDNGVELQNSQVRIHTNGVVLTATVSMPSLPGMSVPVQVQVVPVVRDQQLQLDVLDVQLGGPYAAMGSLVKPMLTAGIAQAFGTSGFVQEARIASIELQEGLLIVTKEPGS